MLSIKQGQWAIALVCFILGIMLAVQFKTTEDMRSALSVQRVEDLSQRLLQTEKERDSLNNQVKELREQALGGRTSKEMQLIQMGAGVVDLTGPGVVVTINDS